ncbi:alpha/beta-hydrolase lipase region [Popillia japonica]|uniref:Lipase n=1 Tax=Popillia japonica TaxID=7064 RepID=A0AAW1KNF1_POPJA
MSVVISVLDDDLFNDVSYTKNPDEDLNTPQIIRRHGYGSESHTIETKDGYLLTLHRISTNKNGLKGGQPVFLQHGLLSSSTDWVDGGDNAVAFLLADAGYDVWLGNSRGNVYSKAHTSIPIESAQFWNFSFHEMGIYDLPAALNYVSNINTQNGKIIYIGHSMGTTMFFIYSSLFPKEASQIEVMVAFAPVAYMTHLRSPVRYLAPFSKDFEWLARHLGANSFLPNGWILRLLAYECELMKYAKEICENIIFVLCGFDEEEFNTDLLPVVLAHIPAGTSTKTVIHYTQEIEDYGNFQCFDYGKEGNLKEYGTETPPLYNLTNIEVPTYLMYADNDLMVNPIDVQRLVSQLPKNIGTYEVPLKSFNHVDFLWGKDAKKLVYEPLLKFLQKYKT